MSYLSTSCPYCNATRGQFCRSKSGATVYSKYIHKVRKFMYLIGVR